MSDNKPTIHWVEPSSLNPAAYNPRKITKSEMGKLRRSLVEFGWLEPIAVNKTTGNVVGGHQRLQAAVLEGMPEVPVIYCDLTESREMAANLALNRVSGEWDELKLGSVFDKMSSFGDDLALDLSGFDQAEMTRIMNRSTPPEPPIPPLPDKPKSKPGTLYVLGRHRLLCGDATNPACVDRLLGSDVPHLMVTDPPYGVEYDANWRNEALRGDGKPLGARAIGRVANDDNADWGAAWALFPGDVVYIWHAYRNTHIVAGSIIASGFELKSQIIWNKSNFAISRCHYHPKHEPCWYAVRKGKTGHWASDRKQTTVWDIPKPSKSETGHSTQKPIECMAIPMHNSSKRGDMVYDPFVGSGTSIVAAEAIGRTVLAMEIDPKYCDVVIKRYASLTEESAADIFKSGEPA